MKSYWIFFTISMVLIPFLFIGVSASIENGLIPADKGDLAMTITTILVVLIVLAEVFFSFGGAFSSFFGGNTFFGDGKEAKRILATGRPATATILSIGENSGGGVVTINDQPYLNLKLMIDDKAHPPYQISLDTVISRTDVPQFQPGASFPVKIDPKDPKKVSIDVNLLAEAGQPTIGGQRWTAEDNRLLKEKGIDGMAKLAAVEETGRSQELQPVIKLTWEVAAPGLGNYTTSSEFPVPTHSAQQLKTVVGKTFPARIHPSDRSKLHVNITF